MAALEEKLGPNFTSDVGQAWEHVFSYLASKVMEAMDFKIDSNTFDKISLLVCIMV